MPEANINDRSSVERLYPRQHFDRDAGENADAKATVHRGLRIVSPVDPNGRFNAERASRHVGESDPEGDTVFLAPFLAKDSEPLRGTGAYGGPADPYAAPAPAGSGGRKDQDYRAFIDRIIEAAGSAEFKPAVGRHEDRLRGFHGG
jgi:hypothetical protein